MQHNITNLMKMVHLVEAQVDDVLPEDMQQFRTWHNRAMRQPLQRQNMGQMQARECVRGTCPVPRATGVGPQGWG